MCIGELGEYPKHGGCVGCVAFAGVAGLFGWEVTLSRYNQDDGVVPLPILASKWLVRDDAWRGYDRG